MFFAGVCVSASCLKASAQNDQGYVFPQSVSPVAIDKYAFTGYYYNGRQVYNLRQAKLSKAKGDIVSMKINPSGSSYALLSEKGDAIVLKIYDLWKSGTVLYEFETKSLVPNSVCYSPDSKSIAVAYRDRSVQLYDTKTYAPKSRYVLPYVAEDMAISDNNYFLATVSEDKLRVYNIEDGTSQNGMLRYEAQMASLITSVTFSSGSDFLMISTQNGLVHLYDTRSFQKIDEFDSMGSAADCDFNPDNKYMAVVVNDESIVLINRFDRTDREYVVNPEGGISDICFVKDGEGRVFFSITPDHL